MSWFSKVKTLEDLKKEYKKLAMQYHPDRPGGDTAKMQQINGEYDRLFPAYQAIHNRTAATPSQETAAQTRSEFYTQNGWKGDNYHPDRSTAEVSKILREYAKRVYPDHKFSITTHTFAGGSSIHVALMAAPLRGVCGREKAIKPEPVLFAGEHIPDPAGEEGHAGHEPGHQLLSPERLRQHDRLL